MNKYWVICFGCPEYATTHGPFNLKKAMQVHKEWNDHLTPSIIVQTVIDIDGKEVK